MLLIPILAMTVLATAGTPQQHVSFVLDAHGTSGAGVAVTLTRIEPKAAEAGAMEPVHATMGRTEPLSLDLPTGNWRLDVDDSSVWHTTQFFRVDPAAGEEIAVSIWPRSLLAGRIAHDAKAEPKEMLVRFESGGGPEAATVSGQLRCPIDNGRFVCHMPAGTYRLRMRPKGFVAQYVPEAKLAAGATLDVGTLHFREGQSIAGLVELPRHSSSNITAVRVSAIPAGARPDSLLLLSARPDSKGFFHIDGVAPGAYIVSASLQRALTSAPVPVIVRAGVEADLVQPLRLNQPRRINLLLMPPAAPDRSLWHVKLYRTENDHRDEVTESNAAPDGAWQSPPLQPGAYEAAVGTISGDEWHRETIAMADDEVGRSILLQRTGAHGKLMLGSRPLQASVTFTSASGFSITAQSDERGQFTAALPHPDDPDLKAIVRSSIPWVQRTVAVKVAKDDEPIDIVLPDAMIAGDVVTPAGAPVANAVVSIAGEQISDSFIQPQTRADGTFEAHGLVPGSYRVIATDFLKESEPVTIQVGENGIPDPLHLVVRDMKQLRGRVVSSLGPVPGAQVQARATNVPQSIVHNRQTDMNGVFAEALPAGTARYEMTVAAPGFSFVIGGGTLLEDPLIVGVDQNGGTIVITAPNVSAVTLVHGGGTCPAPLVSRQWPSQQTQLADSKQQLTIPMMEPGVYAACLVPPEQHPVFRITGGQTGGRCVSGYLPPFGTLALNAESK
jgi:hypothetical protein